MKLTASAKKTLLIFYLSQILILGVGCLIYKAIEIGASNNGYMRRQAGEIFHIVKQLRSNNTSLNHKFVQRFKRRGVELSLSPKSEFLVIKRHKLRAFLQKHRNQRTLQMSLRVDKARWLNVIINNPKRVKHISIRAAIALVLICLLSLFFLSYWACRKLNAPIRKLTENLDYVKKQQELSPIPLIGDEEQNHIFDQINQLQEKIKKLLSDRTHMLAAISHDLRTPLTRLKLRIEYFSDSEHYPKLLQDITEMDLMITESLDYFRDISHDEIPQRFDLVQMIKALVDDARDMEQDIHFHTALEEKIFYGRLNLLKRAINNLINNALKYGQAAEVSLSCGQKDIDIIIEDFGKYVSEEELDKLFLPFYRVDASRSRDSGGSGLGLTIAKEIIQLHDGQISLSHRKEGGLRVHVLLPNATFFS